MASEPAVGPWRARYLPALDGIRGVAVLFVILFHARVVFRTTSEIPLWAFQSLGIGWSGVDLFFVLSGFLITGILLDSVGSPGYFRIFYFRRVLRIAPLYSAYLIAVLVAGRYIWLWHSGNDPWHSTNLWSYVAYLQNWKPGHGSSDLFLDHLWSLAIEEQFYLLWPALIWLLPRKFLKWFCLGLAAVSLAARGYLGSHGYDSEAIYRMTLTHMDGLALGAFVALGVRDFRAELEKWVHLLLPVASAMFVVIFLCTSNPVWSDAPMRTAGALLLVVIFACIVFHIANGSSEVLGRVFTWRPLRECGKYSYAMYILHMLPATLGADLIAGARFDSRPWLGLTVKYLYGPALVALAFGAAWISWRVIEKPFVRMKGRVRYLDGAVTQPCRGGLGILAPL